MIFQIDRWIYEDRYGVKMPWYTYPCLKWLDGLDLKDKDVFEYGIGYSTDWYLSRGAKVYGVESNLDWVRPEPEFYYTDNPIIYVSRILNLHLFDIVIVDGIYRDDCVAVAINRIKPGGYLICDNYRQPSVEMNWDKTESLTQHLNGKMYKQEDHRDWVTAVWNV